MCSQEKGLFLLYQVAITHKSYPIPDIKYLPRITQALISTYVHFSFDSTCIQKLSSKVYTKYIAGAFL